MQSRRQHSTESSRSPREMINLTAISLSSGCCKKLSWTQTRHRQCIFPLCKNASGVLRLYHNISVKNFEHISQVLVSPCVERNDNWNTTLLVQLNMYTCSINSIIWGVGFLWLTLYVPCACLLWWCGVSCDCKLWRHVVYTRYRAVNGSVTACGQTARDRCLPGYENFVGFDLPSSPSPQICVSVVINNVLQVNMTSPLWCEYLLNIGQFHVIFYCVHIAEASDAFVCAHSLYTVFLKP